MNRPLEAALDRLDESIARWIHEQPDEDRLQREFFERVVVILIHAREVGDYRYISARLRTAIARWNSGAASRVTLH